MPHHVKIKNIWLLSYHFKWIGKGEPTGQVWSSHISIPQLRHSEPKLTQWVWPSLVLMSETMVESQSQTWFLADLSSTTLQSGSCQRNPETQPQDITLHNISSVRRLKAISYFMHLCRWLGITEATDFVGSHPKHQSGSRIFLQHSWHAKIRAKVPLSREVQEKIRHIQSYQSPNGSQIFPNPIPILFFNGSPRRQATLCRRIAALAVETWRRSSPAARCPVSPSIQVEVACMGTSS